MLGREEVQSDLLALEPGQRDAHVCGGLGGPALAGDVTYEDSHVHIDVDAQTGLGTGIPGTGSRNTGAATTVTHRAVKQRPLECSIMEHLLTATNHADGGSGPVQTTGKIFYCGATLVKGLNEEKFVARENIATLLRHMWKVTKKRIRLHVRLIRRHRRCGEHHRRSPGRSWHAPGTTASVVATETVE